MRTIYGALVFGILAVACGGGETPKPPEAPSAPPVTPPATTATAEPAAQTTAPAAAKPSPQDTAKAIIAAVTDGLNAHDPGKFLASYADDGTTVVPGLPDLKGKDAMTADVKKFFDAFPNAKFGFSRVWQKNDVLVTEWVFNGTHSGDFMGMKATEKPVGYTGVSIVWVNGDGKIKEEHRYADGGTLFAQLGMGPKGMKARAIPAMPSSTEWHFAKGTPDEDKGVDAMKNAYSILEKKDEKGYGDILADDVVWDDSMAPTLIKGKADNVKWIKPFWAAFPDIKFSAANAWGVEDFAIAEATITGTQKGAFMGIPASKKAINIHGVDIVQIKDGKAIKGWTYGNSVEMMTQLGAMKPPGSAPAATPKADAKPAAPKGDAKPAAPKGDAKPKGDAAPKK
jgi:steroid delta-isomerase-like uncharacterized protein